jgi:hypothetical protein
MSTTEADVRHTWDVLQRVSRTLQS